MTVASVYIALYSRFRHCLLWHCGTSFFSIGSILRRTIPRAGSKVALAESTWARCILTARTYQKYVKTGNEAHSTIQTAVGAYSTLALLIRSAGWNLRSINGTSSTAGRINPRMGSYTDPRARRSVLESNLQLRQ